MFSIKHLENGVEREAKKGKTLWPLFHYILWNGVMDAHQEWKDWEAYVKVNTAFANLVQTIFRPGDLSMC
ncbi:threalose-6-phosphate phosphatase [Coelomomyces lativittatus]|nr:threalose-6-phosphate phosphatase [Coelomomyces lativittatus]